MWYYTIINSHITVNHIVFQICMVAVIIQKKNVLTVLYFNQLDLLTQPHSGIPWVQISFRSATANVCFQYLIQSVICSNFFTDVVFPVNMMVNIYISRYLVESFCRISIWFSTIWMCTDLSWIQKIVWIKYLTYVHNFVLNG